MGPFQMPTRQDVRGRQGGSLFTLVVRCMVASAQTRIAVAIDKVKDDMDDAP